MFLGHFAVGFASKKLAPETNLGWLIAAPIFLDLIWPVFLLLNLEQVKIEPGNIQQKARILKDIRAHGISVDEKRLELKSDLLIISAEAVIRNTQIAWLENYLIENPLVVEFSL